MRKAIRKLGFELMGCKLFQEVIASNINPLLETLFMISIPRINYSLYFCKNSFCALLQRNHILFVVKF
jgi:hypothetical protein